MRAAAAIIVLSWPGGWAFETLGSFTARMLTTSLPDRRARSSCRRIGRATRGLPTLGKSRLRRMIRESRTDSRENLHASLALLPVDASQVDYLFDRLISRQSERSSGPP